jgi:hypothetical protein
MLRPMRWVLTPRYTVKPTSTGLARLLLMTPRPQATALIFGPKMGEEPLQERLEAPAT